MMNQIVTKNGQSIDYLTLNREERQVREEKALQPFVYQNIVKGILSKSKYASKSRTFLTHMNSAVMNNVNKNADKT